MPAPPMPPRAPETATSPQLTWPVVAFWMMVSAPAETSIMPTGPPTPVAMRTPPARTMAPPATYSQLSFIQDLVAFQAEWRVPPMPLLSR